MTFARAITHQKHLVQSGRSLGAVRGVQWTFSIYSVYLLKSQSENKKFSWSVWINILILMCKQILEQPVMLLCNTFKNVLNMISKTVGSNPGVGADSEGGPAGLPLPLQTVKYWFSVITSIIWAIGACPLRKSLNPYLNLTRFWIWLSLVSACQFYQGFWIYLYFRIRHSFAHLRPVILSADWSISWLQSWTCSSLPTVAEFVKLTQSIVIEIQRQSADLYKVQLCNRQFFVVSTAIYVVKVYECHPLGSTQT